MGGPAPAPRGPEKDGRGDGRQAQTLYRQHLVPLHYLRPRPGGTRRPQARDSEFEQSEPKGRRLKLEPSLVDCAVTLWVRGGDEPRAASGSNLSTVMRRAVTLWAARQAKGPSAAAAPIATLERFVVYCSCDSASRLYRPRPRARPRGHGELLKLLRAATAAFKFVPV